MVRKLRSWFLAGAVVVALSACSGGKDGAATTSTSGATSTAAAATTTVPPTTVLAVTVDPLPIASNELVTATESTSLPEPVVGAVDAALTRYVQQALVDPLTRTPDADLDGLLGDEVLASMTAQERTALTDEHIARLHELTFDRQNVSLVGLAGDPTADVALVTATVDLGISGRATTGESVSIARRGQLTFALRAGAWVIVDFELHVEREVTP